MRFGMIGESYVARSTSIADEETINLYVESRQQTGTKSLIYTPGLDLFASLPQSPARGSLVVGSRLFVVGGGNLHELNPAGNIIWTSAPIPNDGRPVSMASNGLQLLIVTGNVAYCINLATKALLDVTPQLAAIPRQVQYSDSYFVMAFKNSPLFQISAVLDGTTWPGIQVNQVSVFPEDLASIIVNHRELWVFGSRHAQPYQDTGSAEVFDVIPGSFIEVGSAAALAPCLLDNSIFWISEDERGGRMAWRSNGYTPARVSTFAVEVDLASYPTLSGMTTYAYQDSGHLFWVLYIPGSTFSWVYDVSESLWHKRSSLINGVPSAHLSWNHAYAFGLHIVGDWGSGNLYAMSQNAFSDNGATIRRVRRAPTLGNEMQFIRHSELVLDLDMGNLSTVSPTNKPAFASALYGPAPGTHAADTPLNGGAWSNVNNVLVDAGTFASAPLTAVVNTIESSTAAGSTSGGGVAWLNPGNIDSNSAFATVSLSAGGLPILNAFQGNGFTGKVSNSASGSNQRPADVSGIFSGFDPNSTPATSATLYVVVSGSIVASAGGGILSLYYSTDSGVTWNLVGTNNATFAEVTLSIPVTGLTNLNTIRFKTVASCSCAPTGFSNVSITLSRWYAILAGSGQPTSQNLVAAISGLVLPDGMKITGLGISFNAEYSGTAPAFQVGLNVGTTEAPFTLTTSPAIYQSGGGSNLWGFTGWDAGALTTLTVNFSASSTGTTTISVNQLNVTVYYTQTEISSDGLDITAFGFAVPDTSTPTGIILAINAYANVSGALMTAQLLKDGFPFGAVQTLPLPTAPTTLTFGGLNYLFQALWQDSDLRASGFGLRITANTTSGTSIQVFIGYTTLELYCPATIQSQTYIGPDPNLTDGNGNPRPPQVVVRWSDDRGKSWSNDHVIDCGSLGDYTARAIIRRLGRSRYRVYEIVWTDPVPVILVDGYLEAAQ